MNDIMEMCMITALFGALYLLVIAYNKRIANDRP